MVYLKRKEVTLPNATFEKLVHFNFRKSKEEIKADKKLLKGMDGEEKESSRPGKYKFIFQGKTNDFEGLSEDYPYNWYLGGKEEKNY